jgi:type IV pilus assembly protein PilN
VGRHPARAVGADDLGYPRSIGRNIEMKIPINLASRPFRRDRAMLVASAAVSVALVATLGALISLALTDRARQADVRREVDLLNRHARAVESQQARLDGVLRRPEDAEVLERSLFLNTLLLRKGVSWTRIFADLEKIVPYNVRIIQVHPSIDALDQVTLDMVVGSESPQPFIELLKGLEASPLFGAVFDHSSLPPTQAEPLYRYHVSVNYAQKL